MVIDHGVVSFILADMFDKRVRDFPSFIASGPSPEDVAAMIEALLRWGSFTGALSDNNMLDVSLLIAK